MDKDPIENVSDSIRRAAEALPEFSANAGFALRWISASAGRAACGGTRVSAEARTSVACAAMSFAGAVLSKAGRRAAAHVSPVVRAACALKAGTAMPRHEAGSGEEAPEGWAGPGGGPFFASAPGGAALALTRRSLLPGGDWTVHYEGIPFAFGQTAADAASRGAELAELAAVQGIRSAMGSRASIPG